MKLNELITSFTIALSNEESDVLASIKDVMPLDNFNEREKYVIENLVKKSVVTKIKHGNSYMVAPNE